ncbi:MAG: tetratricopeptide repeat protein [Pseudomonadota bacterium]
MMGTEPSGTGTVRYVNIRYLSKGGRGIALLVSIVLLAMSSLTLTIGASAQSADSATTSADQGALTESQIDALLRNARQLVLNGMMQPAFDALSPNELQLAGNPDYDYLYGTAALDTGHPDLAVFALERVLEEKPSFAGARLELARAYFALGNNESARYHFDYLQGQNPPPNVQAAITSYLRAIDRVAAAYQPIHIPSFAAGFGFDSNANASTDVEQFLGFVLDGNNVETDSSFYHATLADYYSRPLTPEMKLLLTGAISQRNYPDASFVNATDVNANVGVEWNFGDTKIIPTVGAAFNWLDGDGNLNRYTSDVAVSHFLNSDWKLLGGLTAAAWRFTDDLDFRDANIYNARAGFEHYLDPASGSVISAMAMVGIDDTTDSASPFDNDRWALTVSGSRLVAPRMLMSVNAGARSTEFNGLFFGEQREDDLLTASLSLQTFDWPGEGWRTIARLAYTDVESTIDLYTYDRAEVGLTFYRAFE